MRCDQVRPSLPGFAGGDLRPDTASVVSEHLAGCKVCSSEAASLARVRAGLALVAEREIEPPAGLLDDILERTAEPAHRRVLAPLLPIPIDEVARLVSDHRDTIASPAALPVFAPRPPQPLCRARSPP